MAKKVRWVKVDIRTWLEIKDNRTDDQVIKDHQERLKRSNNIVFKPEKK